jgi:energy-coupling factor transporter transmembrane protein EcfT
LELAAAMDSRGYGVSRKRSRYRPIHWQQIDSAVVASALVALALALVLR